MVGELGERVVWAGCGMGSWGSEEACRGHQLRRADVRGVHWQARKASFVSGWGVVVAQGSSHGFSLRDGRVKGSDLGGNRMSQATAMAQRGLALGRSGSGKLLAASGPILCSRVSFALLGIDPQRPLVDSLIEN